jgi:serine/threonine protein kinase
MEPGESRNRISDLYHRALECTEEERSAFLQEACGGDAGLRDELESLLRYEPHSSRFLERPAAVVANDLSGGRDTSEMIGRHLGPYTIIAPLGSGGMGEVYRARDTKLGRDVAIKILPSHFTSDAERRARFGREARLLATLNHPHSGAIYGLEETDGVTALVLELVEGPTLADRLEKGPLPIAEALAIARQIAEALDAAHEKGIVHRDLKPANIVLQEATNPAGVPSGDVRTKVLDFGLAKTLALGTGQDLTQRPPGSLDGTADGRILGTPAYMSPEQARGQAVDKRTDIWAFGCVFYEMLTGRGALTATRFPTRSSAFWSALLIGPRSRRIHPPLSARCSTDVCEKIRASGCTTLRTRSSTSTTATRRCIHPQVPAFPRASYGDGIVNDSDGRSRCSLAVHCWEPSAFSLFRSAGRGPLPIRFSSPLALPTIGFSPGMRSLGVHPASPLLPTADTSRPSRSRRGCRCCGSGR